MPFPDVGQRRTNSGISCPSELPAIRDGLFMGLVLFHLLRTGGDARATTPHTSFVREGPRRPDWRRTGVEWGRIGLRFRLKKTDFQPAGAGVLHPAEFP